MKQKQNNNLIKWLDDEEREAGGIIIKNLLENPTVKTVSVQRRSILSKIKNSTQ